MALATCAVVGAGIAGLGAAEVLEKSRGVGGRLAPRRIIALPVATGVADAPMHRITLSSAP
jgi:predicted NAD/FAD-dependent oxidoreductase